MAVAQMVIDCDPTHLNWLRIEDNDGNVWRYEKKGAADHAAAAQVEGHYSKGENVQAVLVRGPDNIPLLRQDGPGLPRIMTVDSVVIPPDEAVVPAPPQGKFCYERE
jgi:hypothetical protein